MKYQVALNDTNPLAPLVQVLASAASIPDGYTKIGEFDHPGELDSLGPAVSHVVYQHVQELMYKVEPHKIRLENLQFTHITWPGKVVATAVAVPDQFGKAGTAVQLTATTTPAEVSRPRVKWSTRDDKVAYIDPRGRLVRNGPGKTVGRVDVVDGGAYKEFAIENYLDYLAPASVAITPATAITLTVAAPTAQLTATVAPTGASNKSVKWTSSAPSIATVSATGLVTRVSNGSATITATTVDGAKVATKAITTTA